ncbi:hypothetical protein [Falsirhodobacter xinxiangensis]|uniref:hypothetical protein n=1 Tax=Falsirhodobacter xinxiangensis TaxID=2530049 RepID=UPI0010AAF49F|nr:hypothetical protein [Rhodobacter xinxiangensis]
MLRGLEAPLIGAVVALVGVAVAYLRGRSAGRKQEQGKVARDTIKADRRMDDADIGIGASTDDNREWMHARGKR